MGCPMTKPHENSHRGFLWIFPSRVPMGCSWGAGEQQLCPFQPVRSSSDPHELSVGIPRVSHGTPMEHPYPPRRRTSQEQSSSCLVPPPPIDIQSMADKMGCWTTRKAWPAPFRLRPRFMRRQTTASTATASTKQCTTEVSPELKGTRTCQPVRLTYRTSTKTSYSTYLTHHNPSAYNF